MNRDEWVQIKALAADALALPQSERAAFVIARCGSAEPLQREVLSLIDSADKAADLYETPPVTHAEALAMLIESSEPPDPTVGGRIGAYRVLAEISRGGMGAAYLAARADDAYDKQVAIKLIKRGMDTDAILHRFHRERQILANLEHPNIVSLFDGGTTEDGRPYFVMEFVDGLPIDTYCRERNLSVPERLKLFVTVCATVHHAHGQRILHRDLKPGNILVTKSGVPKLLDFGIARLLASDETNYTKDVTLIATAMTPRYASPEQICNEALTASSDVYSLGVILYELIAGRPPYELEGRSTRDIERVVCEDLPSAPSKVSAGGRESSLAGRIRRRRRSTLDLDAIVLTALAKDPSQRYASARALGEDLERCLNGHPIAARPPPRLRLSRARRRFGVAAGALIAVAGAALAIGVRLSGSDVEPFGSQSVAVLPFVNVGGYPEVEFLSEGLTEDLINRLSRVPQLKVIARESAFRYKGAADPRQIGRKLGVRSILTGRVVQRGSTLLVSAELVDARDRRQIWGERYVRPVSDLQTLQAELAHQIATGLRIHLGGNDRAAMTRTYTQNPDAYEAYLKGRFFWNKRTPAAFRTSIEYFRQAVEIDPQFALAYDGLADAHALLTEYDAVPATETYEHTKSAVLKALAIDSDLPEARTSLAYIHQFYEWDLAAAEREYRRALEASPSSSTGHQWYAEYLSAMGRHDEALVEIRKALAADPLSLIVNSVEAYLLYMAGEYDGALAKAHEVVAMDPNFPEVYTYLKRAYDQKGQYREAIAARQARRRILGLDSSETQTLAEAAAATTPRVYWQKRLQQALVESKTESVQPFEFAEIYAQMGEMDQALEWLERACDQHDFSMMYVRVAPNLAPLRDEPRFRAIVDRGCAVSPEH